MGNRRRLNLANKKLDAISKKVDKLAKKHSIRIEPKFSAELITKIGRAKSRAHEKEVKKKFTKIIFDLVHDKIKWIPAKKWYNVSMYFTLKVGKVEVTEEMLKELGLEDIAPSLDKTLECYGF